MAEHHTPIGPLHGLPISLKDQFHVKGVETSMVGLSRSQNTASPSPPVAKHISDVPSRELSLRTQRFPESGTTDLLFLDRVTWVRSKAPDREQLLNAVDRLDWDLPRSEGIRPRENI